MLMTIPSRPTSRRPSALQRVVSVSDTAGPALERVDVASSVDGLEEDFVRTSFESAHELAFASVVHDGGLLCSKGCGGDIDKMWCINGLTELASIW